ncbi:MAG: hypothetical protein ACRDHX_15280 [Chloroflexota bacterium]
MERIYLYRRPSDGKQVEFFSTLRMGKVTYLIREQNGQDSVATDKQAVEDFREALLQDGYVAINS